jgi:hypothetical protein
MKKFGVLFVCLLMFSSNAFCFSFADDEKTDAKERAAKSSRVHKLTDVPCRDSLKGMKIAVMIAERHSKGQLSVSQSKYSTLFEVINSRLRNLGLSTYSQEDITRRIAEAEIKAYMNNDPDAALSAAGRLGANFILRGIINSRSHVNSILNINEVYVDMAFTLTSSSGRTISGATAKSESWAGADTISTAQSLVEEQADEVVAKLYNDFCRKGATK